MDTMLIVNIVYGILFAYFFITVFNGVVLLAKYMTDKLFLFLRTKKVMKNVDQEFIDYLKEENND